MREIKINTNKEFWKLVDLHRQNPEFGVSIPIQKALFPDSDLSPHDPYHVEIRYPWVFIQEQKYDMTEKFKDWWSLFHARAWKITDCIVPSITIQIKRSRIDIKEKIVQLPKDKDLYMTFQITLKNPHTQKIIPKPMFAIRGAIRRAITDIAHFEECSIIVDEVEREKGK